MSKALQDAYRIVHVHKGSCLALDTETTGVSIEDGDRIIEIGIVVIHRREIDPKEESHFQRYINPGFDMNEEVTKVHGITNEFLRSKPTFEEIADDFINMIKGQVLLIHNAEFDVKFLNMELERIGRGHIEDYAAVIDTMALYQAEHPGRTPTLDNFARTYELNHIDRTFHGALLDSLILAECWLAMTGGQQAIDVDALLLTEPVPMNDQSTLRVPKPRRTARPSAAGAPSTGTNAKRRRHDAAFHLLHDGLHRAAFGRARSAAAHVALQDLDGRLQHDGRRHLRTLLGA